MQPTTPPRIHCAEYVSDGHPDRLADAIAEACVQHGLSVDGDALVGVEVAISTDKVFVTGRIAAGPAGPGEAAVFLPPMARAAFTAAGYGGRWTPTPAELQVTYDLCCDPLTEDERAVRPISDDQAICVGHACGDERTDYQPPAHWLAGQLGAHIDRWRRSQASDVFGPDFKLLPVIAEHDGLAQGAGAAARGIGAAVSGARATSPVRYSWQRLILSMQHVDGLSYEEQHRRLLPVIAAGCAACDSVLPGLGDLAPERLHLNGAGAFAIGGPHGDNGLSGKKLVVDGSGPGVPIGGGAYFGKDPHKADRRGAELARDLAIDEVRAGARQATVTLVFAPGDDEPQVFVER